jgi:predicted transcriptional regulator
MTKKELTAKLGKSVKITTTRLGELVKDGLAVKNDEGDYGITTIGIKGLQGKTSSKIKSKLKSV